MDFMQLWLKFCLEHFNSKGCLLGSYTPVNPFKLNKITKHLRVIYE